MSSAKCSTRRLAVLVIVTSLLTDCATVDFKAGRLSMCPPVVGYDRGFEARAAEELLLLPAPSAVAEMLSDYSVMRDQARICR
jgi:hypothetical protein